MPNMVRHMYELECQVFRNVNRYFDRKLLNVFFRMITHTGGAAFTISIILLLIIFTTGSMKYTAVASAIALAFSHIPVAIVKKSIPRRRPYLVLDQIKVTEKPLKDHSFPSGHTTAIFSVLVPFILLVPILTVPLFSLGTCVGISRIYLGLHYPSDVLVGCLLGSVTGLSTFIFIKHMFPLVFLYV